MQDVNDSDYRLSAEQVCVLLDVAPSVLQSWLRQGVLPLHVIDNAPPFFFLSEVEQLSIRLGLFEIFSHRSAQLLST
ncbi:MAG: hypothetical protein H0W44_02725 [Gammaproteobacteria bacterium]|nr:hypothetical protein [Gammaproteobacteria bacterium]